MISIKKPHQIDNIRKSGEILGEALQIIYKMINEGTNLLDIEKEALDFIKRSGAQPAFLGYNDYCFATCLSVNHEVVHGTPRDYIISKGDLVSVDLGVNYNGMCTDSAITKYVGEPSNEISNLINATKSALDKGINQARVGKTVGDIEFAIGQELKSHNLFPVMSLSGHGIGEKVHEEPSIMCDGIRNSKEKLKEGMTLAIEPMATTAKTDLEVSENGWAYVSKNQCLSAHFEHTILITKSGPEILTQGKKNDSIKYVKNE